MGKPELWVPSRFGPLEDYIQHTLEEGSQVRLKFLNPLGVGGYLVDKYLQTARDQYAVLEEDLALLSNVERQQTVYQADKEKEFSLRMAEIENIFYEMEQRGDVFFEDRFRLARVLDLVKKERLQADFENEVVADVPQRVENKVDELIDWLVESDLRQWKAITSYLADRQTVHKGHIVGEGLSGHFNYDRTRLLDAIGREAERVVKTYDRQVEADKIAFDAQNAVAASLAMEIGAVGLGALITTLATTMAADVTGIVAASLVAVLGFFIIPASRRKAKKELHERLTQLRADLVDALRAEFEKEMTRSLKRVEEAIAPYSRFVRAETERAELAQAALEAAKLEINQLQVEVEGS
jgi:hypothetical protein